MLQKRKRSTIFLYGGVILALCGIYYCGSRTRIIDHLVSYVMYPILVAQNKVVMPIKHYFERNRSRQEMEQMLQALQQEREELVAQNVQLNAMLSYTQETKELVEFKKQFEVADATLTQVLVKHFSDQAHYFLIDKGSRSGIAPDMVAIYKNCLLGKVVEVYPQYSKVLLITDVMCKVAAYCAHTQASGIHEGNNNEMMTGIRYVSHLAEVESDDLVLSSGDGLVFPKGFALGKIKTCNPEGLFYDVTVEPLIDLRKIDYCFIMQKGAVLNESAMSHMLIALAEDHHKKVEVKEEIALPPAPVAPITVSPPLKEKMIVAHPTSADIMTAQELVQQQKIAWQAESDHDHDILAGQTLNDHYNITL